MSENHSKVKDENHQICRRYLRNKKCEFCEELFNDLLNKTGNYSKMENPPLIEEIDRKEFVQNAQGFARSHHLCNKHFKIFRKENKKLNEKGIEIPSDLILMKIRNSDI